jgi:hypothetical protein
MRPWLSPAQINRLAAEPAHCTRTDLPLAVDPRHPFVPEDYTQLYFTPLYPALHFEHRLRYNQLFALRINEYVMMLEADLAERLLIPLKRHPQVRGNAPLITAIDTLIAEERRHFAVFAALNRACRPDLYPPERDRLFSRLPVATRVMFWTAGLLARRLPFSLWYVMAMEESSTALARDMKRRPETETLGMLDSAFTSVHLEHMKDEARHLHIDGILIDLCIASGTRFPRMINARIFQAMLPGVTTPTRAGSGVKVVRQLVREMPELQAQEHALVDAVLALKDNRAYQESLFNRRIMPATFQVFDDTAELACLGERMVGYDRH